MKAADLATIQPSTAASFFIAHAIIISGNTSQPEKVKTPSAIKDSSRVVADSVESPAAKQANSHGKTTPKKEAPIYLKLIGQSLRLCKLCISGDNPDLYENCLYFYDKIAESYEILAPHLPTAFFTDVWTALSDPKLWTTSFKKKQELEHCLKTLMPVASKKAYEEVLKGLLTDMLHQKNIPHTLALWQIVISSPVKEAKANMKCTSVDHLIPVLVNLVILPNPVEDLGTVLLPVVKTVKVAIESELMFSIQARGLVFKLCSAIPLLTLQMDQFHEVSALYSLHNLIVMMGNTSAHSVCKFGC